MRIVVLFVCLCILLLRGYDYIYSGTYHNSIWHTSARAIEKAQQVVFTDKPQQSIKNTHSGAEALYLESDDVEDEDPNSLFARKYRLLARFCLLLSNFFILRYLHKCSRSQLTFFNPLSYKYITQKALRI